MKRESDWIARVVVRDGRRWSTERTVRVRAREGGRALALAYREVKRQLPPRYRLELARVLVERVPAPRLAAPASTLEEVSA
jgi:hypothetical protein